MTRSAKGTEERLFNLSECGMPKSDWRPSAICTSKIMWMLEDHRDSRPFTYIDSRKIGEDMGEIVVVGLLITPFSCKDANKFFQ